jgi:hypothetical protein
VDEEKEREYKEALHDLLVTSRPPPRHEFAYGGNYKFNLDRYKKAKEKARELLKGYRP